MDLCIQTGFKSISCNIKFNPNVTKNGKALADSSHVVRVEELKSELRHVIRCNVIPQTSVSSNPYQVYLYLSDKRTVEDVSCTCVAQAGKQCKHIFALIHFINADRSLTKTDLEQQWGKPSAKQLGHIMYAKGRPLQVIFPKKQMTAGHQAKIDRLKPYDVQLSDLEQPCALRTLLKEYNVTAEERARKCMEEERIYTEMKTSRESDCRACIQVLLDFSDDHESYTLKLDLEMKQDEHKVFYDNNIFLNNLQIIELCLKTLEQSKCKDWFSARFVRISASQKAHSIKIRKTRSLASMIKEFLNTSVPTGTAKRNMAYGVKHEPIARLQYEEEYNVKVITTGIIVSKSQPWLCASPDGIVVEGNCITKILEIKCPSSCDKLPVVDYSTQTCNAKYLKYNEGNIELKTSHIYYTQCQVQLYVLGLAICDLFVWSPLGSCLVKVYRDEVFLEALIPKLEIFYFNHFLHALVMNSKEN